MSLGTFPLTVNIFPAPAFVAEELNGGRPPSWIEGAQRPACPSAISTIILGMCNHKERGKEDHLHATIDKPCKLPQRAQHPSLLSRLGLVQVCTCLVSRTSYLPCLGFHISIPLNGNGKGKEETDHDTRMHALRNQQTTIRSSLCVVFSDHSSRQTSWATLACCWTHNDAVGEMHVAETEGCKQLARFFLLDG